MPIGARPAPEARDRRAEDDPRWTGVVLCGGASRRMGRDKALLAFGGAPLVTRPVAALEAAGAARILAVGGDLDRLRQLDIEAVPDDHSGDGPLGGILTAFRHADTALVAVLACDLPGIGGPAVRAVTSALLASPGAAVAWPEADGTAHVLVAAWRVRFAGDPLAAAFAAGERSVRRAAAPLPHVVVHDVPAEALRNANRPQDLVAAASPPMPQADRRPVR